MPRRKNVSYLTSFMLFIKKVKLFSLSLLDLKGILNICFKELTELSSTKIININLELSTIINFPSSDSSGSSGQKH